VYLAYTGQASPGTTYIAFELNQDGRLWNNGTDKVPCRTTGDLLIAFVRNGSTEEIEVQRWVTESSDQATGCAETGHLEPVSVPPSQLQAAFNSGTIANYLPGFYGATIPDGVFGEAAVNLTAVLSGIGHPCGDFVSAWMHSRSSDSENSQMQDYVAPAAIDAHTCKASPAIDTQVSGPVYRGRVGRPHFRAATPLQDTAHLTGGASPTGTITFRLYRPGDTSCHQDPVHTSLATVQGNGYYSSGQYTPVEPGTYRWVAKYSGDVNNHRARTGCGDATETAIVDKAKPSLSSSASGKPVKAGRRTARALQPIHDTAMLSDGRSPTGSITFRLYGPNDPDCTRRPVFHDTVPVNGNGPYTSGEYTPRTARTYPGSCPTREIPIMTRQDRLRVARQRRRSWFSRPSRHCPRWFTRRRPRLAWESATTRYFLTDITQLARSGLMSTGRAQTARAHLSVDRP
jgi:hypothetical protein